MFKWSKPPKGEKNFRYQKPFHHVLPRQFSIFPMPKKMMTEWTSSTVHKFIVSSETVASISSVYLISFIHGTLVLEILYGIFLNALKLSATHCEFHGGGGGCLRSRSVFCGGGAPIIMIHKVGAPTGWLAWSFPVDHWMGRTYELMCVCSYQWNFFQLTARGINGNYHRSSL